ncbi:uncharacterized protein F5147DRAFT_562476 [Suillus discolor]|uniref:BTB domain-containing protein n=1 Tax=Suillus discolor TaxID=1912936 RepID=A0A9P7K0U4_9AGAM|nr:uncharacterized protein F5147DRAFT_562476 [Suillus discolor]KAG2120486.1 hypothetical protein F5147DRAFT_562476 [Suillus discolor]
MFAASQGTQLEQVDGSTDDKPICVPSQVSESAFELFLSVCYNKPDVLKICNKAVIQLLELSDMYLCKDARVYAVHHLQRQRYSLEPTQLISLALKYNVKEILPHAIERLVSARINDISDDEFRAVGSVVWNTMFKVKERLDVHRRIIACEAPPMVHAGTCTKQKLCEDDWKQLWWNGMGRFLLDGRNPQPYKDAVERFEKLDIGEINLDCWKAVLYIVKARSAFDHERKLITRTADDLVKYLIVEPNFEDFGRLVH